VYLQQRPEPTPAERDQESSLKQNFKRIAGEDMEIDAFELQEILNAVFQKGVHCCIFYYRLFLNLRFGKEE
jgi:hypothetical protein